MVAEEKEQKNEHLQDYSLNKEESKLGYLSSAKHVLHIALCLIMAVCFHQTGFVSTMGDLVQKRLLSQGLGLSPAETVVVEEAVEETLHVVEEVVEVVEESLGSVDKTIKNIDKEVQEIKKEEDETKTIFCVKQGRNEANSICGCGEAAKREWKHGSRARFEKKEEPS